MTEFIDRHFGAITCTIATIAILTVTMVGTI
jgi:hypothetical protein